MHPFKETSLFRHLTPQIPTGSASSWLARLGQAVLCAAILGLLFSSGAQAISSTEEALAQVSKAPIGLYSSEQRSSTFEACKHVFPGAAPMDLTKVAPEWKPRGLCSNHFAVLHSGLTRTPLVVVEKLNRQILREAQGEDRTDAFYEDPRLPRDERADIRDYARSGFDRGHLSAAANHPDAHSMAQSFALSNMVPQHPDSNRKTWNKIEQDTRRYVSRARGDVYVFSGPLFREGYKTIGRGQVWVPTHLFKLVVDATSGKSWAYVLPNDGTPISAPMSYEAFVKETGWQLLAPGTY